MRIALVDPGAFTPESDARTAEALAGAGCQVTLRTAPFVHGGPPATSGYGRSFDFARPLAWPALRALARFGPLRRAVRAAAYPLDWRRLSRTTARGDRIVHLLWSLDPARDGARLARLRCRGIRTVVSIHNPLPRPGDPARLARLEPLLAGADAVVVHSEAARAALAGRRPPPGALRLVPPAIPVRPLGLERRLSARARLGLPADAPVALFFGLLRPYKGLDLLIEAFAGVARRLPAARLLISGAPRRPLGPLRRAVAEAGLTPRVDLEPRYLDPEEAVDRFAAADVVVLPYLAASQSGVLGDALGYARAVVATRVGGLPEMVEDGSSGRLVPPGDAGALAAALGDLLAAPDLARAFGEAGAALAARRFHPADHARALVSLYRELGSV
jgi:glycosyltransferase involved in cell wall biosynthesis